VALALTVVIAVFAVVIVRIVRRWFGRRIPAINRTTEIPP
jgi:hypothetical protein